ncbi:MAG: DMT family transporter [Candidatus Bathyarchaeota archaeon]|nr:DMT family transporter [Candidatus Bathyarchaeota archaeon]
MYVEALGLFTAFCFGLNAILVRKGMEDSTPVTAALVVSMVQVPVLGALLLGREFTWNWTAAGYFVIAGFLASTIARAFNYLGIERVGVGVATTLSSTDPLFSNFLAILVLHEPMVPATVAGVILIVSGVVYMSGFNTSEKLKVRDMMIPVTAAFLYASANMVRKLGMSLLPDAVLGSWIGAVTSLVAYPMYLAARGKLGEFNLTRNGLKYFTAGGLVIGSAMLSMYTAFGMGSISVVTALIGTAPLFSILLSVIFLKGKERITRRVTVSGLMIVLGVLLITVF